MVISLWIYLRAYHRRYQYGGRYRYLVARFIYRYVIIVDRKLRRIESTDWLIRISYLTIDIHFNVIFFLIILSI